MSTTNAVNVLKAAKALVESGWTKGKNARDHQGIAVGATSKNAVCWCMSGAMIAADKLTIEDEFESAALHNARAALCRAIDKRSEGLGIVSFNDNPDTTQADVLAVFDDAIKATERLVVSNQGTQP